MACKQSLDTTLLYYKLSLHPIDVKSILREWHDRLYTNAKTVFWNIQLLCTTTKNFVPSKNLRQMTHEKLYHQLLPNSRLRHEGQSRFHSIYPVHYYRDCAFVIERRWRWSPKVHFHGESSVPAWQRCHICWCLVHPACDQFIAHVFQIFLVFITLPILSTMDSGE